MVNHRLQYRATITGDCFRVLFSAIVFILAGCLPGGDASISVSGTVPEEAQSRCVLKLYYADDGQEVGRREVIGTFRTGFVVEPKVNSFYFTITCAGLGVCRTREFRMGTKPPTHFDLGKIDPECFGALDPDPEFDG